MQAGSLRLMAGTTLCATRTATTIMANQCGWTGGGGGGGGHPIAAAVAGRSSSNGVVPAEAVAVIPVAAAVPAEAAAVPRGGAVPAEVAVAINLLLLLPRHRGAVATEAPAPRRP